jgi:hypothetical protein
MGDFVCGDCASSDAEKARLAAATNRIGAKQSMWLIGRATAAEVTRRNDALLGSVYSELRLRNRIVRARLMLMEVLCGQIVATKAMSGASYGNAVCTRLTLVRRGVSQTAGEAS